MRIGGKVVVWTDKDNASLCLPRAIINYWSRETDWPRTIGYCKIGLRNDGTYYVRYSRKGLTVEYKPDFFGDGDGAWVVVGARGKNA